MRRTRGQERTITGNRQTSLAFADAFVAEDESVQWARDRAHDAGLRPVSPGTGAALRLLAASVDAKAVAEIGTGTGVSGIHLLHGMRPDGVLTTVDTEPERQQFARHAPGNIRLASGPPAGAYSVSGTGDRPSLLHCV